MATSVVDKDEGERERVDERDRELVSNENVYKSILPLLSTKKSLNASQ
jgi:hypothetical protein